MTYNTCAAAHFENGSIGLAIIPERCMECRLFQDRQYIASTDYPSHSHRQVRLDREKYTYREQ